jgi:hypothetical protein
MSIDAEIRILAAERRLPGAHLDRLLAMDEQSRAKFLECARTLRMRTGQIVAALDLLDEIAVREGTSPAAVLDRQEITSAISKHRSGPARASAFVEALRSIRFPQLREIQARLAAEIDSLKLPRGISVVLPDELASDELTVSLKAQTGAEFARLMESLEERKNEIMLLIEKLGGLE